ncbi:hypothetical protein CDCA_CDCA03G1018 [Cyanidium caldarium]|uniref:Secretory carrier membrane protein n=1 Tax=Cyanidium caldarium TaxID=2771 RepID=A0AAV9ISY9_CYACA|nr:hypothetical protein CDCA_CDCA03G1018 [Cyanidium caldarium]
MNWVTSKSGQSAFEQHTSRWEKELGLNERESPSQDRAPEPSANLRSQRNTNAVSGEPVAWNEANWPPLLHMVHIKLSELVPLVRANPIRYRVLMYYAMTLLFINFVVWTVLAAMGATQYAWLFWALSLLDIFLGFLLLAGGYYSLFRACADDDSAYYAAFYGFTGTVAGLSLIISIVGFPFSFNGWTRLSWLGSNATANSKSFWFAMCIIESIGWTVALVAALWLIYKVWRYQNLMD